MSEELEQPKPMRMRGVADDAAEILSAREDAQERFRPQQPILLEKVELKGRPEGQPLVIGNQIHGTFQKMPDTSKRERFYWGKGEEQSTSGVLRTWTEGGHLYFQTATGSTYRVREDDTA